MSNKGRRDGDRRPADRRDSQPDEEPRRQPGDPEKQEGDSLTALKAILGKVAALLPSLKLKPDESVSIVEQLYGSVLEMDLKLAGETDDKRKAAVLAHIKNTNVSRVNGKIVVEFAKAKTEGKAAPAAKKTAEASAEKQPDEKQPAADEPADKPADQPTDNAEPEG